MASLFFDSGQLLTLTMWALLVAALATPLFLAVRYLRRLLVAVVHCAHALDHLARTGTPTATVTPLRSRRSSE
jgi:uncharacterized protein YhhL (DUF1145 family)